MIRAAHPNISIPMSIRSKLIHTISRGKTYGFFSWKTADTKESIYNIFSGEPTRAVYLLRPHGAASIREDAYEGYGVFGGFDAYTLFARWNLLTLGIDVSKCSVEDLRSLGIGLDVGTVCRDKETGDVWSIFQNYQTLVGGYYFSGRYDAVLPEFGMSANDLRITGRFESLQVSDLVVTQYPLKFSFDRHASYERLLGSEHCPLQGYFTAQCADEPCVCA